MIEEGKGKMRLEAMVLLGMYYGARTDDQAAEAKARKLFERAAAEGSQDAKTLLQRMNAANPPTEK